MKKWIASLLAATMTISCVTGCGKTAENKTPETQASPETSAKENTPEKEEISSDMRIFTDMLGREVEIPAKIDSIVPLGLSLIHI